MTSMRGACERGAISARRNNVRLWLVRLTIAVVVYVGSYTALSLTGGYVEVATGNTRMPYGFSISDAYVWQPRFGTCYLFRTIGGKRELRGDLLGLLYAPCALIDQTLVHHPVYLFGADGAMLNRFPLLSAMHPRERARIEAALPTMRQR